MCRHRIYSYATLDTSLLPFHSLHLPPSCPTAGPLSVSLLAPLPGLSLSLLAPSPGLASLAVYALSPFLVSTLPVLFAPLARLLEYLFGRLGFFYSVVPRLHETSSLSLYQAFPSLSFSFRPRGQRPDRDFLALMILSFLLFHLFGEGDFLDYMWRVSPPPSAFLDGAPWLLLSLGAVCNGRADTFTFGVFLGCSRFR